MLNQVLGWMGVANSVTHFAQDTINVVKMANIATNVAESEEKKKEARDQFISTVRVACLLSLITRPVRVRVTLVTVSLIDYSPFFSISVIRVCSRAISRRTCRK